MLSPVFGCTFYPVRFFWENLDWFNARTIFGRFEIMRAEPLDNPSSLFLLRISFVLYRSCWYVLPISRQSYSMNEGQLIAGPIWPNLSQSAVIDWGLERKTPNFFHRFNMSPFPSQSFVSHSQVLNQFWHSNAFKGCFKSSERILGVFWKRKIVYLYTVLLFFKRPICPV